MSDLNLLPQSSRVTDMLDRGTAIIDRSTRVTAVLVALVLIPLMWANGISRYRRLTCWAVISALRWSPLA